MEAVKAKGQEKGCRGQQFDKGVTAGPYHIVEPIIDVRATINRLSIFIAAGDAHRHAQTYVANLQHS